MEILHFVNTKIPPEESPQKEIDFHTLFYPKKRLPPEDLRKIEQKIRFFPGIEQKEVVFFQNIKELEYLVLLTIYSLPEERDTFGRGGIYICHGFLFPPILWNELSPEVLLTLVSKDHLQNLEALRISSLVDWKSGDTLPLKLTDQQILQHYVSNPPELSLEEQQMTLMLIEKAAINNQWPLIIQGTPAQVSRLMNKISFLLPKDLKPTLQWDSGFEGSLSDHPLKIFGFKHSLPHHSQLIIAELSCEGELLSIKSTPECSELFDISHPYGLWLQHRFQKGDPLQVQEIERAYLLLMDGLKAADKISLLLSGFPLNKEEESLEPDELIFRKLYENPITKQKISELFSEIFSGKEFQGIEETLFKQMDEQKAFLLLTGKMDMMTLLEQFLQKGEWLEKEMKQLCLWAKTNPEKTDNHLHILSFLFPNEMPFAVEVLSNPLIRKKLLETLILHHQYSYIQLEQSGFQESEWLSFKKTRIKSKGLQGKLKGLFK